MKVAALDLGTNSFLCLIVDVVLGTNNNTPKIIKVYCDESRIVRLGAGVDQSGNLSVEALNRADKCLKEFKSLITRYDVEKVLAVTTSAARDAGNREEFFAITKKYEIPIELLSGQEEAELTFYGSTYESTYGLVQKSSENDEVSLVIDVGGGSTEIIFGSTLKNITGKSLDIGAVRLTERWANSQGPEAGINQIDLNSIEKDASKNIKAFTEQFFVNKKSLEKIKQVIAVAGTPTTMAAMMQEVEFSRELIDGFVITKTNLTTWINKLAKLTINQRKKIVGLSSGRADIIVAGMIILLKALDHLGQEQLVVSTKGVRYGLALKMAK